MQSIRLIFINFSNEAGVTQESILTSLLFSTFQQLDALSNISYAKAEET